jgi:hypothetical protein
MKRRDCTGGIVAWSDNAMPSIMGQVFLTKSIRLNNVREIKRKSTMSNLANKVALITGGSRGIGAAIAKRLAADGTTVAITYAKDASSASAVVKAIEDKGGKAIAIQADSVDAEADGTKLPGPISLVVILNSNLRHRKRLVTDVLGP